MLIEEKQSADTERIYCSMGNECLDSTTILYNSFKYLECTWPTKEQASDSFQNQHRGLQTVSAHYIPQ